MKSKTEGTFLARPVSRRSMLRGSAAVTGGLALFLIGCRSDEDDPTATVSTPTAAPTEVATTEPTSEATAEPISEATVEPPSEATEEPTVESTPEPAVEAPRKVVVQSVTLTGGDGVVPLTIVAYTGFCVFCRSRS